MLKGNVFRILALSGGGVRGLFQAHFLNRLEKEIGGPLSTLFDLCVGTSIGSVSAGAMAVGISAAETLELYNNHVSKIFNIKTSRIMMNAFFRKGPIFDRKPLDNAIGDLFGDKTFSDIQTGFICTSGELSTYNHRIFSCFDKNRIQQTMLIKDAVLSSCSAPIIFAPYRPKGEAESFIDGGI